MSVEENLARAIAPEAWVENDPGVMFDDPEQQAAYEGFFARAVNQRREPSLDAASRVLTLVASDEAVTRAAALDYERVNEEPWADCPEPVRKDYVGRARAMILAAAVTGLAGGVGGEAEPTGSES